MQVVLFDLGYWIAHRTMHEIPLLWEFHKTHHAAEVLTPLTAARAHPIEDPTSSPPRSGSAMAFWCLHSARRPSL
jgi:sterol desaturase/sphingolipid hydroxylase (fatty acid hydroxylase superfamily)